MIFSKHFEAVLAGVSTGLALYELFQTEILVMRVTVANGILWNPTTYKSYLPRFDRETRRLRAGIEGVDWIRGHHKRDSPEAKALQVAYFLYRS